MIIVDENGFVIQGYHRVKAIGGGMLQEIEVAKLKQKPGWRNFPPEKIQEMAEDIRENGLRQPLQIDAEYVIIDGELRYLALKLLEIEKVACYVWGRKGESEQ